MNSSEINVHGLKTASLMIYWEGGSRTFPAHRQYQEGAGLFKRETLQKNSSVKRHGRINMQVQELLNIIDVATEQTTFCYFLLRKK